MVAGTFIRSTALLNETYFENTIIFITRYDDKGAVGFVVNKHFGRKLNELEEFSHSIPYPLYEGGPVDIEHLFFIHRKPSLITGGTLVTGDVHIGGDFKQAVNLINNTLLIPQQAKLFIGYCGWDNGELDAEIAEDSWEILATDANNIDTYLFGNREMY